MLGNCLVLTALSSITVNAVVSLMHGASLLAIQTAAVAHTATAVVKQNAAKISTVLLVMILCLYLLHASIMH